MKDLAIFRPWGLRGKARRSFASVLALALLMDAVPVRYSGAAPMVPTPASATRDPLIEVSVDSLEISETNANVLGVLWGDATNPTGNEIHFLEHTVPSLFRVGSFDRQQLAGKLSALIKNNQV